MQTVCILASTYRESTLYIALHINCRILYLYLAIFVDYFFERIYAVSIKSQCSGRAPQLHYVLIPQDLYQDCNNHPIGCREEVSAPDGNLRRQSIATQIGDTAAFANQVQTIRHTVSRNIQPQVGRYPTRTAPRTPWLGTPFCFLQLLAFSFFFCQFLDYSYKLSAQNATDFFVSSLSQFQKIPLFCAYSICLLY